MLPCAVAQIPFGEFVCKKYKSHVLCIICNVTHTYRIYIYIYVYIYIKIGYGREHRTKKEKKRHTTFDKTNITSLMQELTLGRSKDIGIPVSVRKGREGREGRRGGSDEIEKKKK